MPLTFNSLLREASVDPADVRLIRHKDKRATEGRSYYELWCDDRIQFQKYQQTQHIENRKKFSASYWAIFAADKNQRTMFTGVYRVQYSGILDRDVPILTRQGGVDKAGTRDVWDLELDDALNEFIGELFIDWGPGALAWVQYADRNDKPIVKMISPTRNKKTGKGQQSNGK